MTLPRFLYLTGTRGGGGGTDGGMLTRRDSRISCISRFSVDSVGIMEQGILGKQQLFTQTGFYKVSNTYIVWYVVI